MKHAAAQPGRGSMLAARAVMAANVCFARVYHRLEVLTPQCLPRSGRAILVCNHTSGLDPSLIQAACPHRLIVWMMAAEFYELPALRWFFRRLEAIPVHRGGRDLATMRQAMRALAAGRVLGIFPEGRIERNTELMPFQTGIAMLALKTKTSVWPAFLDGTQRRKSQMQAYLQPQHARIAFGTPIAWQELQAAGQGLELATNVIQTAVSALRQHFLARPLEKNRNKINTLG